MTPEPVDGEQAPITPLDVTGVRTVVVGTVAWSVAFVMLLPFYGTLRDDGRLWWLWTCGVGVVLGVLGWLYCKSRERKLDSNRPLDA